MEANAYEGIKQQQIAESLERFRREPSVGSALETHARLLVYHENQQAAEFRRMACAQFPDNASLRTDFAAHLNEMSLPKEAAPLYQEALDLDPDLPSARVGVAYRLMAEEELDDALVLLDFLQEPGAGQQYALAPLDTLARSLHRAGRYEEAMSIAEVLLRENPKLEGQHAFRSFVKKLEKALGRIESILPERGFSLAGLFRSEGSPYASWQRGLFIGTLLTALVVGGLAFSNHYVRNHRTLHVLNATGQPAQVQVDNQPAVPIAGMGKIALAEGPHVVKVSGPVDETRNIAVGSSYWGRWFSKPIYVYNVGGEAVLEDIDHVYSMNGTPSQHRLVVGETFFTRPHVDYIFTKAPEQIKLERKNQEVTKTEINWAQADDFNAFMETMITNRGAALDFAEKRLRRTPNQPELLKYYVARSMGNEQGRVETFLKSGLDRRPVDIPWHRAYQNVAELNKHETEIISRYDQDLAADPANAALLYLRGRIDPDWKAQEPYYRRAIAADPKLGWPWLAIAAQASSAGEWDECLKATHKARELNTQEPERIAELLHEARMAKGEAPALVEEYRLRTQQNNQDIGALLFLMDALAASGKANEIDPVVYSWRSRLPNTLDGKIGSPLRALGLYYSGNLQECSRFCQSSTPVKSSSPHLHALIALGRMQEATDDAVFETLWNDPLNLLAVSVGFQLDRKPEDSARWRERAVDLFHQVGGDTDIAKAGKFLSAQEPPSIEEVHQVYLPPANKALLLAALADQFPSRREEYLAEASRFNISHKPSYCLIQRLTERKTASQP